MNLAIAELIVDLNGRAFKKLPGNRASAFATLDAPALGALPTTRQEIARHKVARANIDYHIEFDGHYYSVPHRLCRLEVEVRATATSVEVFHAHRRVAMHAYSSKRGEFTTDPEHMPSSHRAHREWSPTRLIVWGERIGAATATVVRWQMEHRPHPEQGYRACLGLQRLARAYGAERLEAACARAISIQSPTCRSVESILKAGLDRQVLGQARPSKSMPRHENVRGPDYYH